MKSFKVPAFIFLFIGAAVFIGGGFWLKSTAEFVSRAVNVTGEISKQVEDTCERETGSGNNKRRVSYTCFQPFVKYEFKGEAKEAGMSERSSNTYDIGAPVELLVDPASPSKPEFKGGGLWVGPIFLSLFGGIFGLVGFFILRSIFRKEKLVKNLNANGQIVTAKVTFCGPNQSVLVNGRHPYFVEATWVHSSGKVIVAKTQEELWHDPSQVGQINAQGEVQVKFNPNEPENCMVVLGPAKTTQNVA